MLGNSGRRGKWGSWGTVMAESWTGFVPDMSMFGVQVSLLVAPTV